MEEQRYKYTIYKICCDDCDEIYVGSTRALARRKYEHKSRCNNINSNKHNLKIYQTIRDNGGWNNWRMVPIEELQNVSKREAEIKEENYRVNLTANLNSQKASIGDMTMTEYYKQYKKKYRETNKEQISEYQTEYRKNNKEQIAEYQKEYNKEYRKNNKEEIADKKKLYRVKNSNKIKCECGTVVTKYKLNDHKKTPKHLSLMEAKL